MLREIYQQSLYDLGDHLEEKYRGIFSPLYDDELLARYLTPQFTTESQWYIENCEHSHFTGRLLQRCFETAGFDPSSTAIQRILDIGSGAGNSILPLLDQFPESMIVASDLSPQMLLALKTSLANQQPHPHMHLLQLNAERLDFQPESFDMVVGIAILHHLHDPSKTLAGSANILKKGGIAVFSEPFENGNYLLCLAFRMILRDSAATALPVRIAQFMRARIDYVRARAGLQKSEDFLRSHDDKWLFTRQLMHNAARQNGFSDCHIMPLAQKPDTLTRKARVLLEQHRFDVSELPAWAWDIICDVESDMSDLLRHEMPVEAAIILKK